MGKSKDQLQNYGPQSKAGTSTPSPKTPQKIDPKNGKIDSKTLQKIDPKNGKKSKGSDAPKYVTSRMEISAVTINMSGRGVLGVTPKYKVDMVETFLKTIPDLVFLQVGNMISHP